jgi:hypothetical protein
MTESIVKGGTFPMVTVALLWICRAGRISTWIAESNAIFNFETSGRLLLPYFSAPTSRGHGRGRLELKSLKHPPKHPAKCLGYCILE